MVGQPGRKSRRGVEYLNSEKRSMTTKKKTEYIWRHNEPKKKALSLRRSAWSVRIRHIYYKKGKVDERRKKNDATEVLTFRLL